MNVIAIGMNMNNKDKEVIHVYPLLKQLNNDSKWILGIWICNWQLNNPNDRYEKYM